MRYTVLLIRAEEGGYVVRVPALPGCVTEGDDLPQAVENAREAILAYTESLAADGLPLPEDKPVIELYDDEEEAWAVRVTIRKEAAVA